MFTINPLMETVTIKDLRRLISTSASWTVVVLDCSSSGL